MSDATFESYLATADFDDLCSYYSDFHKDVWNFRPFIPDNRVAVIERLRSLVNRIEDMKSDFEGREELRADGWILTEYDAQDNAQRIANAEHAKNWRDDPPAIPYDRFEAVRVPFRAI